MTPASTWRVEGIDAIARGSIGWPSGGYSTLRYSQATSPDTWVEPAFTERWFPDAFAGTMGNLFNAIASGQPAPTSGRDNLKTFRLVEACYLSAEQGRTVALEEIPLA